MKLHDYIMLSICGLGFIGAIANAAYVKINTKDEALRNLEIAFGFILCCILNLSLILIHRVGISIGWF